MAAANDHDDSLSASSTACPEPKLYSTSPRRARLRFRADNLSQTSTPASVASSAAAVGQVNLHTGSRQDAETAAGFISVATADVELRHASETQLERDGALARQLQSEEESFAAVAPDDFDSSNGLDPLVRCFAIYST